jgi:acetyltransferase-like isoleucine patch superfamily enzyme
MEFIRKGYDFLFTHNWLATFYFNFKMLPFRQAVKLPFDFYYGVRFKNLSGKIVISAKGGIRRGMIKIGAQGSDMFSKTDVVIDLRGKLVIAESVTIGLGTLVRVEKSGKIVIGNGVAIGAKSVLFCEDSIIIGDNTITSWDCQIMDTDTHSIKDTDSLKVYERSKPVVIGERCWIGNHVLINKGTVLPDDVIVAACSLCNKNYTPIIEPFSIIGGVPAKLISENKRMLGDKL